MGDYGEGWMAPVDAPIRKHQGFHLCVSWPGPRTRPQHLLKVTHLLGVARASSASACLLSRSELSW